VRARGGAPPCAHGSSQSRRQREVWSRLLLKLRRASMRSSGYGLVGRWPFPPLRTDGPQSKGEITEPNREDRMPHR
jgi:hypothetical protein